MASIWNRNIYFATINGNEPLDYSALDTTNMKHVAVPYSQLSYNPRFYDWPPEPEYARVLKEDPLSKSIVEPNVVDKDSFCTQKSEIIFVKRRAKSRGKR